MNSTILITPLENIDYEKLKVIDNDQIIEETHSSNMQVFHFFNQKTKEERMDTLTNVSLYDDLILRDDKRYKILHMLTK